jgi:hypothetical protein
MNFLCHAMPYLDQPLVAVATGIPDWLSAVDRRIRARGKLAARYLDSSDDSLRMVASGIVRHLEDDRWFHATRSFAETNLELAIQLRDRLPGDAGFRPTFVGHILIEMLLDAFWIRDDESIVRRYYESIESSCLPTIERCVNRITDQPTAALRPVIERFTRARFLYDYLDHDKLLTRLNQVMKRVRLAPLPSSLRAWLPEAAELVESRRGELLQPPHASSPFPPIDPRNETSQR